MSTVFNADDIFEMAEQIERNGAEFYRNAADRISDASAKELLLTFAEMEDQHEKTFAGYRAELTSQEKESTAFDPDDESALYLRALADLRVFSGKKAPDDASTDDLSQKEIMEDIFSSAIQAEKESIVFYVGMQDLVPEALGKARLDGIIKEEMKHIRILTRELEKAMA
jgi:rubrerythrin